MMTIRLVANECFCPDYEFACAALMWHLFLVRGASVAMAARGRMMVFVVLVRLRQPPGSAPPVPR